MTNETSGSGSRSTLSEAWARFRREVAFELAGLGREVLLIERPGRAPYVQARLVGEQVEVEVMSGDFMASSGLQPWSPAQVEEIRGIGFRDPRAGHPNHWLLTDANRGAWMAMNVFRDVVGMSDPTALAVGGGGTTRARARVGEHSPEHARRAAIEREAAIARREARRAAAASVTDPTAPAHEPAAKEQLEALIGLTDIKRDVELLAASVRAAELRRSAGVATRATSHHLVFAGNPGTAKTTVARILGRLYAEAGLLSKGHVVEVSRAQLVARYIGQTAPKVEAAVRAAKGGVLFIDEAYTLAPTSHNDFGHEAIATLLQAMENQRGEFIVIAAGYPEQMKRFIEANPGLASRFRATLDFPDYSDDELVEIFGAAAAESGLVLGDGVEAALRTRIPAVRPESFGNGRFMRAELESALLNQGLRITRPEFVATDESVRQILPEDLRTPLVPDAPAHGLYL